MKLVFYTVDNSQDFDRHSFDNMEEEAIFEQLEKLSEYEVRVYDFEHSLDALEFANDYNDELLDGGWWCVIIL